MCLFLFRLRAKDVAVCVAKLPDATRTTVAYYLAESWILFYFLTTILGGFGKLLAYLDLRRPTKLFGDLSRTRTRFEHIWMAILLVRECAGVHVAGFFFFFFFK